MDSPYYGYKRKRVPHCEKCGHDHYNMLPCGGVLQTPTVQLRRPRVRDDGSPLDFGDRLETVVSQADGRLVGRIRKPLHSEMSA